MKVKTLIATALLTVGSFSVVTFSLNTPGGLSSSSVVYASSTKKIRGHRISKPRLVFKYSSIIQNATFDPTKGVRYYYTSPDKVKISYKSHVDSSKPGKYAVIYHVKDKAGYNFHVTHYVTVRGLQLKKVYNPNEVGDGAYKVSPVGTSFKLTAMFNIKKAKSKGISWTSSNPQVASVSSDGKVTPQTDGVTMITTKFGDKTISTPVLVSEGSNINVTNSDDIWSQIDYNDEDGITYKQTNTLQQVITGLWFTNGEKFIYSQGQYKTPDEQAKQTSDIDDNFYSINNYGGYRYEDTFLKTGDHVILQTQDELGESHLYIGKYNE